MLNTIIDIAIYNANNYTTRNAAMGNAQPATLATEAHDGKQAKYITASKSVTKKQADACNLTDAFALYCKAADNFAAAVWAGFANAEKWQSNSFAGKLSDEQMQSAFTAETVAAIIGRAKEFFLCAGLDKKNVLKYMFATDLPKEQRPCDSAAAVAIYSTFAPFFIALKSDSNGIRKPAANVSAKENAKTLVSAAIRGAVESEVARIFAAQLQPATLENSILDQRYNADYQKETREIKVATLAAQEKLAAEKATDTAAAYGKAMTEKAENKAAKKPATKTAKTAA